MRGHLSPHNLISLSLEKAIPRSEFMKCVNRFCYMCGEYKINATWKEFRQTQDCNTYIQFIFIHVKLVIKESTKLGPQSSFAKHARVACPFIRSKLKKCLSECFWCGASRKITMLIATFVASENEECKSTSLEENPLFKRNFMSQSSSASRRCAWRSHQVFCHFCHW